MVKEWCLLAAPPGLLHWLLYSPIPTCIGMAPPTVGWVFLHQSLIKKLPLGQSEGGIFLHGSFLFPDDPSSFQTGDKTTTCALPWKQLSLPSPTSVTDMLRHLYQDHGGVCFITGVLLVCCWSLTYVYNILRCEENFYFYKIAKKKKTNYSPCLQRYSHAFGRQVSV